MARKKKKSLRKSTSKAEVTNTKEPALERLSLKTGLILLFSFIALSFVLYQACISYGFVLDDKIVLSENNFVKKGLAGIPELFSTDSFQGYFGEQKDILQGGRYRPLSLVSFAVEFQFFGLNAAVFHTGNIILYGISIFIAFLAFRRLFREKLSNPSDYLVSVSLLASLLFLFHPIHTEAVANIKGRDEIMAFLFSMLCLLYALKYFDSEKWSMLLLSNLFYLLGLFSKENTLTFFAIVPLSILLFRQKKSGIFFRTVLSLLATSALYLIIRIQALGYLLIDNPSNDIMNNPFAGMSFIERYSTVAYTLLVYLKLVFVPIQLTHDYYPYHIPIMSLQNWEVWLSILLHLLMVAAIFYYWKSNKIISYALGFYLLALSIVSNILVNVGTFMNERFIFTAVLGMCLLIVYLADRLQALLPFSKKMLKLPAIITLILLAYSFKTIDRVPAWKDELSLNQAAIKVSKNSARANSFMATAYFNRFKETQDRQMKRELMDLAMPHARRAVEIYPKYYNGNLMLSGVAAEIYKFDGDLLTLLNTFKQVARNRPDVDYLTTYLKYLNDKGNQIDVLSDFYLELGRDILYTQERNYSWSIHYLLLGNAIDPGNTEIRQALVKSYEAYGRKDLADRFR